MASFKWCSLKNLGSVRELEVQIGFMESSEAFECQMAVIVGTLGKMNKYIKK